MAHICGASFGFESMFGSFSYYFGMPVLVYIQGHHPDRSTGAGKTVPGTMNQRAYRYVY
jgi:hypothetical protein